MKKKKSFKLQNTEKEEETYRKKAEKVYYSKENTERKRNYNQTNLHKTKKNRIKL